MGYSCSQPSYATIKIKSQVLLLVSKAQSNSTALFFAYSALATHTSLLFLKLSNSSIVLPQDLYRNRLSLCLVHSSLKYQHGFSPHFVQVSSPTLSYQKWPSSNHFSPSCFTFLPRTHST